MNIAPTSSISGMDAARLRMDNTANNVANVNTPDFRAQRVEQVETTRQTGQMQTYQQRADSFEPGTGAEAYAAGTRETDLAQDMTNIVADRNAYTANAEATRVQNNVAGMTIDMVA